VRLGDGLLVTVHAPADEIAKRLPWGAGALEPIDPHHYEYRTSDDNLEWLALRVAMLGADVDVHEPTGAHRAAERPGPAAAAGRGRR
jgi:hypothetical protein